MILYNQLSIEADLKVGTKGHVIIKQWRSLQEDRILRVCQYVTDGHHQDNTIFLTVEQAESLLLSLPQFIKKAKLSLKPTSRKIKVST